MAKIHPDILTKLKAALDIGDRRVYDLVAAKAGETHLPRHLAALQLAADNGININKKAYATEEERALMRAVVTPAPRAPASRAESATAAPARKAVKKVAKKKGAKKSNTVWVVYGRNTDAKDALFEFLRALGLKPLEFAQAVKLTKKGAPYVGEVLEAAFDVAAAVVVLLTPDDEARLRKKYQKDNEKDYEKTLTGQARPNVIFEAGRAFGTHRTQTIIVQLGETRPFSDTEGVHIVRLANTPEVRRDLANRLESAGCEVDTSGADWLKAGDFSD